MKLPLKLAIRAIVAFPVLGALAGILSGIYGLLRTAFDVDAPRDLTIGDVPWVVEFGSYLGATLGFVLGLLILWPTRYQNLWQIGLATVLGTVFGAIVEIEVDGEGFLFIGLPVAGFVVGVLVLFWILSSRKISADPLGRSEIND